MSTPYNQPLGVVLGCPASRVDWKKAYWHVSHGVQVPGMNVPKSQSPMMVARLLQDGSPDRLEPVVEETMHYFDWKTSCGGEIS